MEKSAEKENCSFATLYLKILKPYCLFTKTEGARWGITWQEKMKKLVIGMIALVAIFVCSSCNKYKTCKCTEYYYGTYEDAYIVDTESEGATSCSQVEERWNIRYGGSGVTFKCTSL